MAGDSMTADLAALGQVPGMIQQVRAMFEGFQAAAEVAEAVGSTGSPAAGATIAMLGAEILLFIGKAIDALDDNIDNLRDGRDLYTRNEQQSAEGSSRMSSELGRVQYA